MDWPRFFEKTGSFAAPKRSTTTPATMRMCHPLRLPSTWITPVLRGLPRPQIPGSLNRAPARGAPTRPSVRRSISRRARLSPLRDRRACLGRLHDADQARGAGHEPLQPRHVRDAELHAEPARALLDLRDARAPVEVVGEDRQRAI